MSLKKSALILSLSAAMALLNTFAFAIDMSSSQVIKTTGKVSVKKVSSPEFKKLNSNLKLAGSLKNLDGGDKVRTFTNSTADLALKDTCILLVKEQSIFEVPQVLTQKDLKVLKAQQGSVLFKVAKGSNFQVQTADVVCGVKGTMFSVNVVDGLDTLIETPGLQLGYASAGGTSIEVYEGEVEVKDKKNNRTSSLKSGQGLFTSKGLKNVMNFVFDPGSRANELYGNIAGKLMQAKGLSEISQVADAFGIGGFSSKALYHNSLTDTIAKLKPSKLFDNNNWGNIVDFKEQKFRADFEKYRLNTERSFTNSGYGEAYIGKNANGRNIIVACCAANGSTTLKAEPGEEGIVITEGLGNIIFQAFDNKLNSSNKDKILINLSDDGNNILTTVRNTNGQLCWREPGSLDIYRVPQGDVVYAYNKKTAKGSWFQATPNLIPNELDNYKFSMISAYRQQKSQVDQANTEMYGNKLTNVIEKNSKNPSKVSEVTNTIKSFGGLFKRKR